MYDPSSISCTMVTDNDSSGVSSSSDSSVLSKERVSGSSLFVLLSKKRTSLSIGDPSVAAPIASCVSGIDDVVLDGRVIAIRNESNDGKSQLHLFFFKSR